MITIGLLSDRLGNLLKFFKDHFVHVLLTLILDLLIVHELSDVLVELDLPRIERRVVVPLILVSLRVVARLTEGGVCSRLPECGSVASVCIPLVCIALVKGRSRIRRWRVVQRIDLFT